MRNLGGTLTDDEIETLRINAFAVIAPLRPTEENLGVYDSGPRTRAGQTLPPHYLVYFLLADLLRFRNLGTEEKVAWSFPVDLEGRIVFIEHRKMGLGVFGRATGSLLSKASPEDERAAERIVSLLEKAVGVAQPFFSHLAACAVKNSQLNVTNDSRWLFDRYTFARDEFRKKLAEAESSKGRQIVTEYEDRNGEIRSWTTTFPEFELQRQAAWLGVTAIEAFFGWTEHVFIHIAIMIGNVATGEQFEDLAAANWQAKAKHALDLTRPALKQQYDDLLLIRKQIRNYIAHGAFGNSGEAFHFHSAAGAVPVTLTESKGKYAVTGGKRFDEIRALDTVEAFIAELWRGPLEPAKIYIQDAELPLILTFASDGTYKAAMSSVTEMERFVDYLTREMDDAANMDW
jgi:hypothetical protein